MNQILSQTVRQIFFRITIRVVLCAAGLGLTAFGKEVAVSNEYKIKAVFLFNFIQFTEWPASSFPDPGAPIRIGVFGQNPFGSALEEAVHGETAHGRKLVVQYASRLAELRECQLIFVGESEKGRIADILKELGSAAILTISELPEFARQGGIIRLYNDGRKVRFVINLQAAQRRNLKLDAQLLSLAKIVSTTGSK